MPEIAFNDPVLVGTQAYLYHWPAMANGDTGKPVEIPDFADKTVTIEGGFGSGGSCTLKGSNDGTNYYALTDPQGNAITKTAAAIEAVSENPRYIRPEVTAGTSVTIQVRLVARRGSR